MSVSLQSGAHFWRILSAPGGPETWREKKRKAAAFVCSCCECWAMCEEILRLGYHLGIIYTSACNHTRNGSTLICFGCPSLASLAPVLKRCVFRSMLPASCKHLRSICEEVQGHSWDILVTSWGHLERSWEHLGRILELLGLWKPFWLPLCAILPPTWTLETLIL